MRTGIIVGVLLGLGYLLTPRIVEATEIFVLIWPFLGLDTAVYFAWESLWLTRV